MTPERWRQVEEIVHAALSRGESERPALAQKCAGDEALRARSSRCSHNRPRRRDFWKIRCGRGAPLAGETGASMFTCRRLGGYEIHARIGVGGMGEVYRARDTKSGRDLAIKILPSAFTTDPYRPAPSSRGAALASSIIPTSPDLRTGRRLWSAGAAARAVDGLT